MDASQCMTMGESTAAEEEGSSSTGTTRIEDLPESVMAEVISLTSPRDACRCAAVSPAFRDAADSDAVWGRFLSRSRPRSPPLATSSSSPEKKEKKKEAYLRMCDVGGAVVGDEDGEGETAVWVARESGGKCVALSARRLSLPWDDGELTWRWTPHPKSRFAEVAQLVSCTGLDIYGRLPAASLTPATDYAAYLVYGVADGGGHRGLSFPDQETTVAVGARAATRHAVCLRPDDDEARKFWGVAPANGVRRPAMRDDGWSEMEMGRLRVDESVLAAAAEEVVVSFEVLGWYHKSGLVVEAVEFRAV